MHALKIGSASPWQNEKITDFILLVILLWILVTAGNLKEDLTNQVHLCMNGNYRLYVYVISAISTLWIERGYPQGICNSQKLSSSLRTLVFQDFHLIWAMSYKNTERGAIFTGFVIYILFA